MFSSSQNEFNFIKKQPGKSKISRNLQASVKPIDYDDEDRDQYTSDNHSLIPYLYMFKFFDDNIGYVLLEPQTRHLIAVDMGEFEVSSKIIKELEK